jgi:hypothetical protein
MNDWLQRQDDVTPAEKAEAKNFADFFAYSTSIEESLARWYSQVVHENWTRRNAVLPGRATSDGMRTHGGELSSALFLAPAEAKLFAKELRKLIRELNWGKPRKIFFHILNRGNQGPS